MLSNVKNLCQINKKSVICVYKKVGPLNKSQLVWQLHDRACILNLFRPIMNQLVCVNDMFFFTQKTYRDGLKNKIFF